MKAGASKPIASRDELLTPANSFIQGAFLNIALGPQRKMFYDCFLYDFHSDISPSCTLSNLMLVLSSMWIT
ncbi:MAG: hypothetical protein JWP81_3892 [Ferruginibacter sp.]|nr:hypothetical protein [Ferruginibacter sp.]